MPILVPVRVCYVYNLLTLQYPQFCTQLMKAYMAETSCNQLLLIDYSATYMLIKICVPVVQTMLPPFSPLLAGLRGAIAFALAIRNTQTEIRQLIFTTTLMIVIVTVFINGGLSTLALQVLKIK